MIAPPGQENPDINPDEIRSRRTGHAAVLMLYFANTRQHPFGLAGFLATARDFPFMPAIGMPAPPAHQPEPSGTAAWQTDLPGIDLESAQRYSNGKYPLFLKMLQIFQETHGQRFVPNIRAAIANGNWHEAGRLAHTFKTSARLIGAIGLGDRAEALEAACKAEPPAETREILTRLLAELDKVKAGMSHLTTPMSPPTSGAR